MEELVFAYRAEWRRWLKAHHKTSSGVWLVFYTKPTGRTSLAYDDAVEAKTTRGEIGDEIIVWFL